MVSIKYHSGIYTLTTHQLIKSDIDSAWNFFSSPINLSKITPEHMGFFITSKLTEKMYCGQIITYKVNVFPGIAVNWVTEITHVDDKKFFVDEQRFGPYAMWHHEHHFKKVDEGVIMTDIVSYKLPLGIIGRIFHPFVVQPQLKKIFNYRGKILDVLYHKKKFEGHFSDSSLL